jgi:hypothetical protein
MYRSIEKETRLTADHIIYAKTAKTETHEMINWSVDYGAHTSSITAPIKNASVSAGLALIKFRCSSQHTSVSIHPKQIKILEMPRNFQVSLHNSFFFLLLSRRVFFPFCVRTIFNLYLTQWHYRQKCLRVCVFSQLYSYVAAITHSCGWLRHSAADFSIRIIFSDREGALPWPIKVGISPKKKTKKERRRRRRCGELLFMIITHRNVVQLIIHYPYAVDGGEIWRFRQPVLPVTKKPFFFFFFSYKQNPHVQYTYGQHTMYKHK